MKEDRENVIYSKADSYKDYMTKKTLIDTLEAIFCLRAPIILCVATSSENTEPKSEDIEAFILKKEDVVEKRS